METVPTKEDDPVIGSSTAVLLKEAVGYTGGEVVVTKVVGSRAVLPSASVVVRVSVHVVSMGAEEGSVPERSVVPLSDAVG